MDEIEKLENVIEAILFVSGDGVAITDIMESLELQKSEVTSAVNKLKKKYSGSSGVQLLSYNGKIQLGSNPDYAEPVSFVLNPIKEKELSTAALETIAIVAYKQPVTRLEVEQVRGVSCEYAIQVLLKHNLVEAVGRKDVVGKPILFGTTEQFLKRFRIESIDELPDYERLLEMIQIMNEANTVTKEVQETQESQSMYNEYEIPDEEPGAEAEASVTQDDLPQEEIPDFLENIDNLQRIE